jgi:hypothetical protein
VTCIINDTYSYNCSKVSSSSPASPDMTGINDTYSYNSSPPDIRLDYTYGIHEDYILNKNLPSASKQERATQLADAMWEISRNRLDGSFVRMFEHAKSQGLRQYGGLFQ